MHKAFALNLSNFVVRLMAAFFVLLMFPLHSGHAHENAFTALRTGQIMVGDTAATRLVIEMQAPIMAELFLLDDPYRIVLDADHADWDAGNLLPIGNLDAGPVKSYRYGRPKDGVGRLVFELSAPAAPIQAFILPPRSDGGHRLVIDVADKGRTAFKVAKAALQRQPFIAELTDDISQNDADTKAVASASQPVAAPVARPSGKAATIASPSARPDRWVVMIDAGHGGKDPGAVSKRGTREKEITLKAARILAAKLNATGRVIAKLTRNDDRYLKLRERIAIARRAQADLFISLHADAFHNPKAKGISVFSLSDTASDKEAAYLASRENQADLIGGPDLEAEDPDAANELLRMFQRESMNESAYLANNILTQIKDLPGGDKRGHRFAGFAVLKSPDVPSVLVEMGFLTNKQDEENLLKPAYLDGLAGRLSRAILAYLERSNR